MRARGLARDLEQLRVALVGAAGTDDGGYWAGRVARLEREAAMVEEAGRRGREWLDLARDPEGMGGGRVDVVEARIVEAADQWAGLVRQQRVALATRYARGGGASGDGTRGAGGGFDEAAAGGDDGGGSGEKQGAGE